MKNKNTCFKVERVKESNSGKKNISYLAFQTIQESDLTFCANFVWKI